MHGASENCFGDTTEIGWARKDSPVTQECKGCNVIRITDVAKS